MNYQKIISYCVPVMNRMEDIKSTLMHNLMVLRQFSSVVDIHVASFDQTSEVENWIRSRFADDIDSGLLKFHHLKTLPYWHFCWAKNSFKTLIDSNYYSSLDADNLLSESDVENTLRLISEFRNSLVIHHFSGIWGDGTSGRVTIPTHMYRECGYFDELFPRQFDDISLILRVLQRYPDSIFVCRPGVDIFRMSQVCSEYIVLNELTINRNECDLGATEAPLNPRGKEYLKKDQKLALFQEINQCYALLKISTKYKSKEHYEKLLKKAQNKFAHDEILPSLLGFIFDDHGLLAANKSDVLTVYAVIKNDFEFLERWYQHYHELGVKRFILVDDHSDVPIETILCQPDVFVVRPRVGEFKYFKAFWLMALMKKFQEQGSWLLTVDSDEFIDIPKSSGCSNLGELLEQVGEGSIFLPGILVDMMPGDHEGIIDPSNYIEKMNICYFRPSNEQNGYQYIKSVVWAFGRNWRLSFKFDIRWHLFNTIDCLRKVPVIRYGDSVTLNQGFHALYYKNKEIQVCERLLDTTILPIRHYKLYKYFSGHYDTKKYRNQFVNYFWRSSENLNKIFSSDIDAVRKAWMLTPFKMPYSVDIIERAIKDN